MPSNSLAYPYICGLLAKNPTSLSRAMHNAGFNALNLPFCYSAFDTQDTESALVAMRALGLKGLSLTIPHKEKAMEFVDSVSEAGRKIGAINTVINNGYALFGDNTDWLGILAAFDEQEIDLTGRKVLIFGAGGAARAAIYAFKERNADWIGVANRTNERSEALAREFDVNVVSYDKLANLRELSFDVFVQSTPLGSVLAEANYPFSINPWPKEILVFDMVTKETPLISAACVSCPKVVRGVRMLLHQALAQFELFTGMEPPFEVMQNALMVTGNTSRIRAHNQ